MGGNWSSEWTWEPSSRLTTGPHNRPVVHQTRPSGAKPADNRYAAQDQFGNPLPGASPPRGAAVAQPVQPMQVMQVVVPAGVPVGGVFLIATPSGQ